MAEPLQTPAASSYIPVVTDALRLARVLVSPGAVFAEQRDKPAWVVPWLVVSAVLVAVGLVMAPYTTRMIELAAQQRGQPAPGGAAGVFGLVAVVMTPIGFLLLALVSAGVMWVTLLATGGQVRFKGLLSAAVFSSSAAVIQVALQGAVLRMRGGPEAIQSMADARVSLGLDVLLSADAQISGFLRGVLGGVGPLQIWALAITAIGVATLEKQSRGAAWTAATASYVVLLLVSALFAGMGGAA